MIRTDLLLAGLDVAKLSGLEIGPLNNPAVPKSVGEVSYIDHDTSQNLRTKYAGQIDPSSICEVDYVWGNRLLSDAVAGKRFDYVVASHVIEHVPNLVGWLQEIADVLSPNGRLCLAVPDKRYTFDLLRPISTVGEILQSHLQKATVPSPKQLYDNYTLGCQVDAAAAWAGQIDPSLALKLHPPGLARAMVDKAFFNQEYIDCHCWIFTPESFLDCHQQLVQERLTPLSITQFEPTQPGSNEFFVQMSKH